MLENYKIDLGSWKTCNEMQSLLKFKIKRRNEVWWNVGKRNNILVFGWQKLNQ